MTALLQTIASINEATFQGVLFVVVSVLCFAVYQATYVRETLPRDALPDLMADPISLAYLGGGATQVYWTVIADLFESGKFEITPTCKIIAAADGPTLFPLPETPYRAIVMEKIAGRRTYSPVSQVLLARLDVAWRRIHGAAYARAGLITPTESLFRYRRRKVLSCALLIAICAVHFFAQYFVKHQISSFSYSLPLLGCGAISNMRLQSVTPAGARYFRTYQDITEVDTNVMTIARQVALYGLTALIGTQFELLVSAHVGWVGGTDVEAVTVASVAAGECV